MREEHDPFDTFTVDGMFDNTVLSIIGNAPFPSHGRLDI